LVTAVVAMGLVPLVAEAQLPPVLYRCTVYDYGVPVGAGRVIDAYVGTETTPRASGTTGANGVCILQVSVTMDEVSQSEALSFKVDGVDATETPDVDVTLGAPEVRLDVYIQTPLEVGIDIKPGSFPNSINLKSKGVIPVVLVR